MRNTDSNQFTVHGLRFVNNKRGELLIENVVFMILNLAFLSILVLFLAKQGGAGVLYEEAYSKNIALLIDSAKPGMIMKVNMKKGLDIANEEGILINETVKIDGNNVLVRLSSENGKKYHFFNDVNVSVYPDVNSDNKYNGLYVVVVNAK